MESFFCGLRLTLQAVSNHLKPAKEFACVVDLLAFGILLWIRGGAWLITMVRTCSIMQYPKRP